MVVVAVAGTGNIGKQILKAILATGKHRVIILSRSEHPSWADSGAIVRKVDYTSHADVVAALQGIHTLLSCIFTSNAEETIAAQVSLLEAAKEAGVKRFAPSEYSYQEIGNTTMELYASKKTVWKAVQESGLEYTAFRPGQWMNYFAHGSPHPEVQEKAFDGLRDFAFIVDLSVMEAVIPGTGDEKVTLTTTQDVGRFVAAALDFDTWEPDSFMAGNVTTYNEVVKEAERITGKKIKTSYESVETLEKMIESAESFYRFYLQAKLSVGKGEAFVHPVLNKRVDFTPTTVPEFLEKWWGSEAQAGSMD